MPSNYFLRLTSVIRAEAKRSLFGKDLSCIEGHVDVLIGQEKVFLGQTRLFHSLPSGIFTDLNAYVRPGTVAAAQVSSHLVNRRKNLSVVRAFSRAISIPSVSGPSFQVCGYHIECLLSESDQVLTKSQKVLMASCRSASAINGRSISGFTSGHVRHGLATFRSFGLYGRRRFENCGKITMCLKNEKSGNNFSFYQYFVYNVAQRGRNLFPGFGSDGSYYSSAAYSSADSSSDALFDRSVGQESHSSSADSELNIPGNRSLKLNSGSYYLPHPEKEETGGEDAHFICTDEQAIGVADGVGGWIDHGIDAGQYARELMSNSVNAIKEEPKGSVDPARVLEKAYSSTKAKGSSTACIIALTDQGLQAINLGDSGFMVVRDGCTVFRSPAQQHDFNFTYQLESENSADLPSSGQVFNIPVAPGDVIIAGTDGLFDNLYNSDITAIVVHSVRAGLEPQVTAQKIAALARQRAQDKNRQTPFSTAAQEAGFRYYGGKLDDITVVVSYITNDHKESDSARNGS